MFQAAKVANRPAKQCGATVLKDKDLDALPDDPDELESALQALAGPSAGPNGGQIYIDILPADSFRQKNRSARSALTAIPFQPNMTGLDLDVSRY